MIILENKDHFAHMASPYSRLWFGGMANKYVQEVCTRNSNKAMRLVLPCCDRLKMAIICFAMTSITCFDQQKVIKWYCASSRPGSSFFLGALSQHVNRSTSYPSLRGHIERNAQWVFSCPSHHGWSIRQLKGAIPDILSQWSSQLNAATWGTPVMPPWEMSYSCPPSPAQFVQLSVNKYCVLSH